MFLDNKSKVASIASTLLLTLIPFSAQASIGSLPPDMKSPEVKLAQSSWQPFRSRLGRFTASFQNKPNVEKRGPTFYIADPNTKSYYLITYLDAPNENYAEAFLKDNAKDFVASKAFRVTGSKDISLDSHPGTEINFTATFKGGKKAFGVARAYAVNKRIYMIYAVDENNNEQNIKRFLDSFKLS
jgi:hypothetical protein